MAQKKADAQPRRRMRGFETAAQLLAQQVRVAGESRGFAVARLLTHWEEVVGPEIAAHARPVKISHGKNLGATLTLLVAGARAPMIEMQAPRIRERVNACYGFNAVARIVLTQTAPTGFAEGQTPFTAGPRRGPPPPDPAKIAQADGIARDFDHPALSAAMRQLALNILSRRDINDRKANP